MKISIPMYIAYVGQSGRFLYRTKFELFEILGVTRDGSGWNLRKIADI